jgi:pilus assembly protein CpaE
MRTLIVGDNDVMVAKARTIVARSGLECRSPDVVPLQSAADSASGVRSALIVLIMSGDPQRAMEVLRDIHTIAESTIVAVGPASDPQFILRALREGAHEYLDERELESQLQATLVRIKVKKTSASDRGRVIGVLGACGGCGSSTLAANLAVALAKRHERAMLIDMRLTSGDQTVLLDLKPVHTLVDLCRNVERMDQGLLQRSLVCHSSGVHLLAAPRTLPELAHVSPQAVRQVLRLARTQFPVVVADLDRSYGREQTAVILQTDVILLVLRLDMSSLRNGKRLLDHLNGLGIPAGAIKVVVNRYGQPKEISPRRAEQALGVDLFYQVPNDPKRMNLSTNNGIPVILARPWSRVARRLTGLAQAVSDLETAGPDAVLRDSHNGEHQDERIGVENWAAATDDTGGEQWATSIRRG